MIKTPQGQSGASEPTVAMFVVRRLAEFFTPKGTSPDDLLRAAGIESGLADSDAWLSHRQVESLCELGIRASGDPAVGLHWVDCVDVHSFEPISNLLASAGTLRRALEFLLQYRQLYGNGQSFLMIEDEDL